jgi:prolyl-tRNA synthetase
MEMGCYGIGVTRVVAAAIEQNNDAKGIILPPAMAPFEVAIAPIGYGRSADVKAAADKLYIELCAVGIDCVMDDRDERPGVMFADLELIGVPYRITLGDRGLKEGNVEFQGRTEEKATSVKLADVVNHLKGVLTT